MNKTVTIIKELSADEKVRYEVDMRECSIRDYNSAIYSAHKQGIDSQIVSSISGLSKEEIETFCK